MLWYHYICYIEIFLNLAAHSIYLVHDEIKDKLFELELSWVGKGILQKTGTI